MSPTTRAVLVGCGAMSEGWIKILATMPEVELVGLVDIVREAAEQAAQQHGLKQARIGVDLDEMLAQTRPDVVFNLTVPAAHAQVVLTALAHGCHVLEEKPMAASMAEARQMIAAAEEAGKILAITQNYRYNAPARSLRSFLASGVIGQITMVNVDFMIGAHFGGFRAHMEHVLLQDMAIHTFDMLRMLSGADPVSVYCHEWNPAGSWFAHDAAAAAIFEMTGGIVANYRGCWCAEGLNTSWNSEWRFVGDKGSVRWDGNRGFQAQVRVGVGGFISEMQDVPVPISAPEGKVDGHADVIREFIRCVREGGTPETIATDNIKSLAMVFGAIESADLGRPVRISV